MPSVTLTLTCLILAYSVSADDLGSIAKGLGQISIFLDYVNSTGVIDELQDEGPYTIFSPNDDASQNYSWPTNQTELADLIRYHIVKGNYSTDLLNGTMEALDGSVIVSEPIDIDKERIIAVNDAYVVEGDHYFDKGVLHIISKVLDPSYQNEANQNADDNQESSPSEDDSQGQQQQPRQAPYNGYNEAARPPYQPRGYGAAPFQPQNPTGFGGNGFGLGNNGLGAGLNGNNGGLGGGLNNNFGTPGGDLNGNNGPLQGAWNGNNSPLGGGASGNGGPQDGGANGKAGPVDGGVNGDNGPLEGGSLNGNNGALEDSPVQSSDDDQGGSPADDDSQDQQQQQQPQDGSDNDYNEPARAPYQSPGYGTGALQPQNQVGFGGNGFGLGPNRLGAGLGGGLNNNYGPLRGAWNQNGPLGGGTNGINGPLLGGANGINGGPLGGGGAINGPLGAINGPLGGGGAINGPLGGGGAINGPFGGGGAINGPLGGGGIINGPLGGGALTGNMSPYGANGPVRGGDNGLLGGEGGLGLGLNGNHPGRGLNGDYGSPIVSRQDTNSRPSPIANIAFRPAFV